MPDSTPPRKCAKKKAKPKPQYGWPHRIMRYHVLMNRPLCQVCEKNFSTIAHHKVYKERMTLEDYLAVCETCHKELHKK